MPEPSWVRARTFSIRWNRSKTHGSCSGAIPIPVSRTVTSTEEPRSVSSTAIVPSKVTLNALESRLRTIFSHIARSTWTGARPTGLRTSRPRPACSMVARNTPARLAVTAPTPVGS